MNLSPAPRLRRGAHSDLSEVVTFQPSPMDAPPKAARPVSSRKVRSTFRETSKGRRAAPPHVTLVTGSFVDVRAPTGGRAAEATPRRPEDHREDEAEDPHDQEDHADRLDAHARDGCSDRPREDRSRGDQENADTNSH